jgi:predicted ABC-type ATPase
VPAEVVKRRFVKGLNNLFKIYMSLVDYCAIFDNSSPVPGMAYEKHSGKEDVILPEIYAKIVGMLGERK